MTNTQQSRYLAMVQAAFPDLAVQSAQLRTGDGQFNNVLIINEALVARFPRTPAAAAALAREAAVLRTLHGRLPLAIPDPILFAEEADSASGWMAYPLIPGIALVNEVLEALPPDDQVQIMLQLAGWLKALHSIPVADVLPDLPAVNVVEAWDDLFARFATQLFPFMRTDACDAVQVLRAELLDDLRRNPPTPVLCHGDFGGGNILYDPATRRVNGIIDFGGVSVSDPATDVASLSCYGEAILALGYAAYPAMAALLPRARRYRATFALQQALWALEAGDEEDFEDGIAAYR